jgi:YVTN family beta-propeller protein
MIATLAAATLLGGCGQSNPSTQSNVNLPTANRVTKSADMRAGKSAQLYVGNWPYGKTSFISVYNAKRKGPLATITDGVSQPLPAIGPDGRLYVANSGNATVTIYDSAKHHLMQTLSTGKLLPRELAFDSTGTIYVLCGGGVVVFPNGSQQNAYTLPGNRYGIVVDSMNDLYVSAGPKVYGYKPGARKHFVVLHDGISSAASIAIDANDNLYIANSRYRKKDPGSVAVYDTVSNSLEYVLTDAQGVHGPTNLLVGSDGNLYVTNGLGGPLSITVYPLGQTTLARTISSGLNQPAGLAMDSSGNLYVSNLGANDVAVYAPNTTAVLRTITRGMAGPYGLAFGL